MQPENWHPKPLEFVFAPKSQNWFIPHDGEDWCPKEKELEKKLRPLAHVDLKEQVVATAAMLCMADRVETALGSTRGAINSEEDRALVNAYGNRLFCVEKDDKLHHTWGSTKLYRSYFEDYQKFVERPDTVSMQFPQDDDYETAIIHSDLAKFYDQVRPELMKQKLERFIENDQEKPFFSFVQRLLNWDASHDPEIQRYAKNNNIENMNSIVLPQGLVSSGFFANMVLFDFYMETRNVVDDRTEIGNGLGRLLDACFYVDDIRLVVQVKREMDEDEIREKSGSWLQGMLDVHASGLRIAPDKTDVIVHGRNKKFIIPQSLTAKRIQGDVSGVIDPFVGSNLIDVIEGFFHTQQHLSILNKRQEDSGQTLLVGVPDIRDETVARFSAGRFRQTFRSLRPLLMEEVTEDEEDSKFLISKQQLDNRAKVFSATLIDEWVTNPSHVRLLRIALDFFPHPEHLDKILKLLQPGWNQPKLDKSDRAVRNYCLSEIFRAGAIETGRVLDNDSLPSEIDIEGYHERLVCEGQRIVESYTVSFQARNRFPWYLMQQVLLYLLAQGSITAEIFSKLIRKGRDKLGRYIEFASFLSGRKVRSLENRAVFFTLAKSSLQYEDEVLKNLVGDFSNAFLKKVNSISPGTARQFWEIMKESANYNQVNYARNLGIEPIADLHHSNLVNLTSNIENPLHEEINFLRLAKYLLSLPLDTLRIISPWNIECEFSDNENYPGNINDFKISKRKKFKSDLFHTPEWCETDEEIIKHHAGLLLLYAIRGNTAIFSTHRYQPNNFPSGYYRRPVSHWEQQKHSAFVGRSGFGEAWIPLSYYVESLLFDLLRWPGAGIGSDSKSLQSIREEVRLNLQELTDQIGRHSNQLFLRQLAPIPYRSTINHKSLEGRKFRVGIVQSVIPDSQKFKDNKNDLTLTSNLPLRIRHRVHIATLLQGVKQMLSVRRTHISPAHRNSEYSQLDLLVFPELAIHPQDIDTLLVPFVRKYKCIVLAGIVYHTEYSNLKSSKLLNSCIWLVPEWRQSTGFQLRTIEQIKKNLAPEEEKLSNKIQSGFRPAQWLIEYELSNYWSIKLNLSASVCYDATDLDLVADLRSMSDIYFVCALNKDVSTFDNMAESLSYHMYQGVILVNNGEYGGSSFYMPFRKNYRREVFHLHGQPQATIAFAEIDPLKLKFRPNSSPLSLPLGQWKEPPAGWKLL